MTQLLLRGAPVAVLLHDAAGGSSVVVRSLVAAMGLSAERVEDHARTVAAPTVGLFGSDHEPVPGCYAWYVGPGTTPQWMHASRRGAVEVLQLLGTAFAQERAGAAFRAAGADLPTPREVAFDPEVLSGVSRAVRPSAPPIPAPQIRPLHVDDLLRNSFAALERCCHTTGAIAAAPRGEPGGPDYWFFWQRDAAAAALALHGLSEAGPTELRPAAARLASGYVDHITRLGEQHDLSASRWSMDGSRVSGYGDPQYDGPAATVLAVLTIDPQALAVARPFVEQLLGPGARTGYDLWELTRGRSFHAANLRRRALRLVARLSDGEGAEPELLDFDDGHGGWVHVLDPEPAWFARTSRLDVSVLGSALLAYEPGDLDDPRLHRTVERLEEHYRDRWPINASWQAAGRPGGGIGRFPEDGNDGLGSTGGNPWPVATLWLAQYHLHRGDQATALGYLDFVVCRDALAEQIDGDTGAPRGARDLAWTHAELVVTLLALDPVATGRS